MDGKPKDVVELLIPTGEPADGALLRVNGENIKEVPRRFAPILHYLAKMQEVTDAELPPDLRGFCKNATIAEAVFKATSTVCHDMMMLRKFLKDLKPSDVPLVQSRRNFGSRLTHPVKIVKSRRDAGNSAR